MSKGIITVGRRPFSIEITINKNAQMHLYIVSVTLIIFLLLTLFSYWLTYAELSRA